MTILAIIAVSLAVGAWWGIRWSEASRQVNDLTAYLVSIPADEWRK